MFGQLYEDKCNPFALHFVKTYPGHCLEWLIKQPETECMLNMVDVILPLIGDQLNKTIAYHSPQCEDVVYKTTPFLLAVRLCRKQIQAKLVKAGANVHEQDFDHYQRPMHALNYAIRDNDLDSFERLLEYGCTPHFETMEWAFKNESEQGSMDVRLKMYHRLLDLNVPLDGGELTLIHLFVGKRRIYDPSLLKRMLNKGEVDVNTSRMHPNYQGEFTPLELLDQTFDEYQIRPIDYFAIARVLVQYGAKIRTKPYPLPKEDDFDLRQVFYQRIQRLLVLCIPVTLPRVKRTLWTKDLVRMLDSFLYSPLDI